FENFSPNLHRATLGYNSFMPSQYHDCLVLTRPQLVKACKACEQHDIYHTHLDGKELASCRWKETIGTVRASSMATGTAILYGMLVTIDRKRSKVLLIFGKRFGRVFLSQNHR
ncbi:hypothetical protein GOP47_0030707, partial [Adiantum capillus-veneris]